MATRKQEHKSDRERPGKHEPEERSEKAVVVAAKCPGPWPLLVRAECRIDLTGA